MLLVIAEILPTEPTPKIEVIPGAYIMEIYTNTTRPTPGHDKANIFLVIPGAKIIVVNATFVVLLFWSNYHATMTCPYYANVLEVLGQHFNYLVYTGNATTKFWQKCPCHLMQRTVN